MFYITIYFRLIIIVICDYLQKSYKFTWLSVHLALEFILNLQLQTNICWLAAWRNETSGLLVIVLGVGV